MDIGHVCVGMGGHRCNLKGKCRSLLYSEEALIIQVVGGGDYKLDTHRQRALAAMSACHVCTEMKEGGHDDKEDAKLATSGELGTLN